MGKRVKRRITNKQIKKAVYQGIKRNADRIFDLSQRDCPVDKGTLKKSGYIRKLSNGAAIGYRAPYAAVVEFGNKAFPFVGDTIVKVKKHFRRKPRIGGKRRSKKWSKKYNPIFGVEVREHKRVIHDAKIVPMKGKGRKTQFRQIDGIPEREGKKFLTNAVKRGLRELPNDIAWALNKIKSVGSAEAKGG